MGLSREVVCSSTSFVTEFMAYMTLASYGIIINRTLQGREPGPYLFITTLTPLALVLTKLPTLAGLLLQYISMRTALLFVGSTTISWTFQAMFSGKIDANIGIKIALAVANMALVLYFIVSTSRFTRSKLYEKCKAGVF